MTLIRLGLLVDARGLRPRRRADARHRCRAGWWQKIFRTTRNDDISKCGSSVVSGSDSANSRTSEICTVAVRLTHFPEEGGPGRT